MLDTRVQFPGSTLADLCDPLTMPPALLKAHQKLDAAVDAAYAPKRNFTTDAERLAFPFERYRRLTPLLPAVPSPWRRVRSTPRVAQSNAGRFSSNFLESAQWTP